MSAADPAAGPMATGRAILLWVCYAGLGILFVSGIIARRAALASWRRTVGGPYDPGQHCFVTELELDRRRLPPESAAHLRRSRAIFAFGLPLLALVFALQLTALGT